MWDKNVSGHALVGFIISGMEAQDFYPLCSVGPDYHHESDSPWQLRVADVGTITISSGKIEACDPFFTLSEDYVFPFPNGTFPVKVTVADASEKQDWSHEREAYLSIIVRDEPAVAYRLARPVGVGEADPLPIEGFWGVGVDSATVGLVDADAAQICVEQDEALDFIWPDDDKAVGWWDFIDDSDHYEVAMANIPIPGCADGASIVISHSGWGDGHYPVVYSYNAADELVACHVDFKVVGNYQYDEEE